MPPKRILSPTSARRVTLVAPLGGDFTTIAAALMHAAAQSPTVNNRWMLLVYPGTYTEDLTFQNYVDVVGVGPPGCVVLNGRHKGAICQLRSLTLELSSGVAGAILTYDSNGYPFELIDCRANCATADMRILDVTAGTGRIGLYRCQLKGKATVITQSAGYLYAEDCALEVDSSGVGYPFKSDGGTLFELRRCTFIGGGSNGEALYATAGLSTAKLLHCTLRKGSSATYSIGTSTTPTITTVGSLANAAAHGSVSGVTDMVIDAGV